MYALLIDSVKGAVTIEPSFVKKINEDGSLPLKL